jgi:hypothetical protein
VGGALSSSVQRAPAPTCRHCTVVPAPRAHEIPRPPNRAPILFAVAYISLLFVSRDSRTAMARRLRNHLSTRVISFPTTPRCFVARYRRRRSAILALESAWKSRDESGARAAIHTAKLCLLTTAGCTSDAASRPAAAQSRRPISKIELRNCMCGGGRSVIALERLLLKFSFAQELVQLWTNFLENGGLPPDQQIGIKQPL